MWSENNVYLCYMTHYTSTFKLCSRGAVVSKRLARSLQVAAFILLCRTNIKTLWQTWMLHNRHTTLYNKIVTSFIKEGDIQKRSGHYNKYGWKLSKSWYLYIIFRLSKTRKWPPNTLKFRNFPVSIWLIFLQLFWVQPCHK